MKLKKISTEQNWIAQQIGELTKELMGTDWGLCDILSGEGDIRLDDYKGDGLSFQEELVQEYFSEHVAKLRVKFLCSILTLHAAVCKVIEHQEIAHNIQTVLEHTQMAIKSAERMEAELDIDHYLSSIGLKKESSGNENLPF